MPNFGGYKNAVFSVHDTFLRARIGSSIYAQKLGEYRGPVISSLISISYTIVIMYLFVKNVRPYMTKSDLLLIGTFWLIITIIFEFVFGHYVAGQS